MNNKYYPYDKTFIEEEFDTTNELNPLKELAEDVKFEEDYVKWAAQFEKWDFESLEAYALEYYTKNRMN